MNVAIVTGGSNGIGKSTALELAKRGIGIILTYNTDAAGAHDVAQRIEHECAVPATAVRLDLAQPATFADFSQTVKTQLAERWQRERFDYLVNNGGVGGGAPFDQISEAYFDTILGVNFKGPFFLTQRLLALMEDGGAIVNTSSGSAHGSSPGYSAYGPSKAALSSWTRYLAKELAPRKIRVNAISPGPVHTNIAGGAFDKHPEFIEPLAAQTALGRIGSPDDIANVIAGLLSSEFGWVTAQDIEVSGGFLL